MTWNKEMEGEIKEEKIAMQKRWKTRIRRVDLPGQRIRRVIADN